MIRFRTGQRWKREPSRAPVDGLALELDGLDVLSGASEEPLDLVVPQLVHALSALASGREVSQLSLPEAHLELCLRRRGAEVELRVASLARPARIVRPKIRLDLLELMAAAARCGRSWLADAHDAAPALLRNGPVHQMLKDLGRLEEARPEPADTHSRSGPVLKVSPSSEGGFGFSLVDREGLLSSLGREGAGALTSLLCEGTVWQRLGDSEAWRSAAVPFLAALELSRQASELLRALETSEASHRFRPAGIGPEIRVELQAMRAHLGDRVYWLDPVQLSRAAFQAGLDLALAVRAQSRFQRKNPYLQELLTRCREGLAESKQAVPPNFPRPRAAHPKKAAPTQRFGAPGRLKRLGFEPRWEKHNLGGSVPGALWVSRAGPIFSSPEMAAGFAPDGSLRFRRVATHGVAVSADGRALCAEGDRLVCFAPGALSARWFRDHDGLPIGPRLDRRGGLLLTISENRAVIAWSEATGREAWRFAPPRTHRAFFSVLSHRVLVATDSGHLYGLDLADGQVRYRLRAPLPFAGPPIQWARRLIAPMARGDHLSLLAADVHTGRVHWTAELPLARGSPPLVLGGRVLVAGERGDSGALVSLTPNGERAWERRLHLGPGPYALAEVGRSVVAVSSAGGATRVDRQGQVEWHLGSVGEPVARAIPATLSRGVLVLPGPRIRAVDPRGGTLLAELTAGAGLCDLATDAKLNLYLLDEEGGLAAYRLSTHLSIVD